MTTGTFPWPKKWSNRPSKINLSFFFDHHWCTNLNILCWSFLDDFHCFFRILITVGIKNDLFHVVLKTCFITPDVQIRTFFVIFASSPLFFRVLLRSLYSRHCRKDSVASKTWKKNGEHEKTKKNVRICTSGVIKHVFNTSWKKSFLMPTVIRILKKAMEIVQKTSTQNVQICTSGVIEKKKRLILEGRFDHFFDTGTCPVVIQCIAIKTDCSKK